ncbi:MAG: hypothetical protein Q8R82_05840 [Hyphomonadaceae bacterium]|nr:hypothetical protein [Hyphomonadaceae bacterium]
MGSRNRGKKAREQGPKRASVGSLDLDAVYAEMSKQSDRGTALIAGELVNSCLQVAIWDYFAKRGDEEDLFFREGALLGPFSARIKIAYASGVISESMRDRLTAVRKVRNHFAHEVRPHEFDEPYIVSWCDKLLEPTGPNPGRQAWKPERWRYIWNCINLCERLLDIANKAYRERVASKLAEDVQAAILQKQKPPQKD